MPKLSFHERLRTYVGGIVRVRGGYPELTGQIGLLVGVENFTYGGQEMVQAELFIDGRVTKAYFYTGELEFVMKTK